MATRSQKVKLGVFLTGAFILLVLIVAVLSGIGLWEDRVPYFIEFRESVSGLEEGAPVSLNGVEVGTVDAMRVQPQNSEIVEVRIRVDQDTPVKTDAKAFVNMQGVTGLKYIELSGGSAGAEPLEPGSEIEAGRSVMTQLTGQASDIGLKVEKMLNNVLYLTRESNRERFDRILANAEDSSQDLDQVSADLSATANATRQLVEENREPLTELIENANRTSERTDETLTELLALTRAAQQALDGAQIPQTVSEVRETNAMLQDRLESVEMNDLLQRATTALDRLTALLDDLGSTVDQNRDQLRATIQNMRMAAESFKELARSLQSQPSRLFFDDDPEERQLP